jgi:hypothetical protein
MTSKKTFSQAEIDKAKKKLGGLGSPSSIRGLGGLGSLSTSPSSSHPQPQLQSTQSTSSSTDTAMVKALEAINATLITISKHDEIIKEIKSLKKSIAKINASSSNSIDYIKSVTVPDNVTVVIGNGKEKIRANSLHDVIYQLAKLNVDDPTNDELYESNLLHDAEEDDDEDNE